MNMPILSSPHLLTRAKSQSVVKLERLEPFPFQEQFPGPLPLHCERTAAEILAERLAEFGPHDTAPLFIP